MPSPLIATPTQSQKFNYDFTESPIAPGTLKARENKMVCSEMEKLLLERLLLRKDLRIKTIQTKLQEVEKELATEKEQNEIEIKELRRQLAEQKDKFTSLQEKFQEIENTPGLGGLQSSLKLLDLTKACGNKLLFLSIQMVMFPIYWMPCWVGEQICLVTEYILVSLWMRMTAAVERRRAEEEVSSGLRSRTGEGGSGSISGRSDLGVATISAKLQNVAMEGEKVKKELGSDLKPVSDKKKRKKKQKYYYS
eukprot:TRINITY_DN16528_c0_g1_i1.p1 TRINITY_DN16528_c0_g1~~TRINITY_DN16528_c0_g1_i1.p1  ORF type:complete len:262 (-),score=38.25 TRINITY_DN16528_c0_g1_i1:143-895(-)